MTTTSAFPASLDTFVDPAATSKCNGSNPTGPVATHAALHTLENDAIAALQEKVGIDSSADHNSLDYKIASALAGILALQGTSLLYGPGAPASGTGVDGNFYLDETAHMLYGPKASGAWPAGTSIIGPQGPAGADGSAGAAGPSGHGSTTTTAAPSASGGNWLFTVGDTTAFVAFGTPVYCSDSTNSIYGTVVNVISTTQITVAPTTTTGTVTSITNGSTFTFSGVQGPAGGGGGGAMTKIAKVVTSGSQSSVVFSSIPQTYSNLLLCFQGRSTSTSMGEVVCYCKINGDGTSGNYSGGTYIGFVSTAGSVQAGTVAATANGACIGVAPGTPGNANAVGQFTCNFINYAGTAFYKNWQSVYTDFFGGGSASAIDTGNLSGVYKSTSAINSITLTLGSGNFVDGSTVVLYGIS